MGVGERIKELRTQKKLTQQALATLVGMTYIQIGRYETQKSNPSSEVLQRIAKALDTTSDFLMNGGNDEVVSAQLTDRELLNQFKEVEKNGSRGQTPYKNFSRRLPYKKANTKTRTLNLSSPKDVDQQIFYCSSTHCPTALGRLLQIRRGHICY